MAKTYRNSAEVLAEHALRPDLASPDERTRETFTKPHERRMIYNGTMPIPAQNETPAGVTLPPSNRRYAHRKVSPFNIVVILILSAVFIVLYIGNIIAVDQLVSDIHKSDVRLQEIQSEQEVLRARINQMSSLERIRKRAEDELGLKNPTDAPGWIEVDPEKIRTVEETSGNH